MLHHAVVPVQDYHLLWCTFPGTSRYYKHKFTPGWSAFARRYLRSRFCFPFLQLLRCFSSLRSPPYRMHSGMGNLHNRLGFPIRRFLDHSSVTSSLRLIASSYVLHRLSTPRHPPYALNDLVMPTRLRLQRSLIKSAYHDWVCKGLSQSILQEDSCRNCFNVNQRNVDGQTIHITNIFRSLSKLLK